MLEKNVIKRVLHRLPGYIYTCSLTGASMTANGISDRYFDLDPTHPSVPHHDAACDLWLEFKVSKQSTKRPDTRIVDAYTAMQKNWLRRRYANGKNAFGVVAVQVDNKLCFAIQEPRMLELGTPLPDLISADRVATWITEWCCGSCRQSSRL